MEPSDNSPREKKQNNKPSRNLREIYDPPNDNATEFTQISDMFWNFFCDGFSKWTIRIIYFILIPLLLIVFAIVAFPNLSNNPKLLIYSTICVASISFLSGVFGFTVKGFLKRMERLLNKALRKIIFGEPIKKQKPPYNQTTITKN